MCPRCSVFMEPQEDKRLNVFQLRSETKQGCSLSLLPLNTVLEVQTGREGKEKEKAKKKEEEKANWKGRSKISSFTDDIFLHLENPKSYI